jgi:two-component system CheB/CheR fusion protein
MTGLDNALGRTARELVPALERKWIDFYASVGYGRKPARFQEGSAAMGREFDVFATPVEPYGRFALVFRDVTRQKMAEEKRDLLIAELNHRVKNNLATIQAIANQTARHAPSLEAFSDVFSGRLRAIASANDVLTDNEASGGLLANLVKNQITPYGGETGQLHAEGPRTPLDGKRAHALGMAFHELATNACKYGAWSKEQGKVDISWTHPEAEIVEITWRESGGPPVEEPERRGFGSRLIEASIRHTLGGTVSFEYPSHGMKCTLRVPLKDDKPDTPT